MVWLWMSRQNLINVKSLTVSMLLLKKAFMIK
ncbi:hypothetical protein A33I_11520 [Alkalihalophilus marmarensis DSM 21297]|uniref:Uncharacterized protein n=1 Tax=Alkalihalophilus marmarensis DSM 21297 TaxID=1188261 RepID=U6SRX3_9BACI|nr:hypothetical protein A33I_11520 [Alkalihalophilus marmarensis DSM 21297]